MKKFLSMLVLIVFVCIINLGCSKKNEDIESQYEVVNYTNFVLLCNDRHSDGSAYPCSGAYSYGVMRNCDFSLETFFNNYPGIIDIKMEQISGSKLGHQPIHIHYLISYRYEYVIQN